MVSVYTRVLIFSNESHPPLKFCVSKEEKFSGFGSIVRVSVMGCSELLGVWVWSDYGYISYLALLKYCDAWTGDWRLDSLILIIDH